MKTIKPTLSPGDLVTACEVYAARYKSFMANPDAAGMEQFIVDCLRDEYWLTKKDFDTIKAFAWRATLQVAMAV